MPSASAPRSATQDTDRTGAGPVAASTAATHDENPVLEGRIPGASHSSDLTYYLRMHADSKKQGSLPVEQADLAAEVFRMLAEPTRVRLLWAMLDQELPVNELADVVGKPAPSVSQHLAKLRMARLVHTRREGTQVFYRVENDHVGRLVRDAVFNAEHAGPDVPRHHQDEATPLRSNRQRGTK
jgi:ArsR family transcriptional regulator, zinc-responsive transcriptional repressor